MSEKNNHSNQYSAAGIERYRRGELSAAEMHAMEKAALDDPFLADAMEGYTARNQAAQSVQDDLATLQQRLAARIAEKEKTPAIPFLWWKAAAIVIVLVGAAWLYRSFTAKSTAPTIAGNTATRKAPESDKADAQPPAAALADTLHDVAIESNRSGTRPGKAAFSKPSNKSSTAAMAPPTDHAYTPEQKKEAEKAMDTAVAKDNVAAAGRLAPKPVAADLEQKTKGLAVEEDKTGNAVATTAAVSNTFNGTLVDELNRPVAHATVQIPNLHIATVTDNKGFFSFKAPDTTLKVSIASTGYETKNVELSTNTIDNTDNIIMLKPALISLQEVAVTGYSRQKKNAIITKDVTIRIIDAEPVNGWTSYQRYIDKNKKVPGELKDIHGEVVVSFTVDSENRLRHFHIDKSLLAPLDTEATRLVQEGPAWKVLKGKKATAYVTVQF